MTGGFDRIAAVSASLLGSAAVQSNVVIVGRRLVPRDKSRACARLSAPGSMFFAGSVSSFLRGGEALAASY